MCKSHFTQVMCNASLLVIHIMTNHFEFSMHNKDNKSGEKAKLLEG